MTIKTKNSLTVLAIYFIILLTFIAIFLFIPFPKVATSWITFAFSIFAILLSLGATLLSVLGKDAKKNILYNLPIFKIGALYALIQLGISIILCTLASFFNIPTWISILICLLLLAAALVCFILVCSVRSNIVALEAQAEIATQNSTEFYIDAAGLVDLCENTEIRKMLEKLAEEVKYSDPVSSPETQELEARLSQQLEELRTLILGNDEVLAKAKTKEIISLLAERNRICKAKK